MTSSLQQTLAFSPSSSSLTSVPPLRIISHSLLLESLAGIGVDNTALLWFSPHLTDRKQFIQGKNVCSTLAPATQGVPQGLVLGPLLFIIYLLPLGHILRHYKTHFHCYADDTQLYIPTKPFPHLPSPAIKSLSVTFDSTLSFSPHINNITRTAFFHLHNTARLHSSLSQHSIEVLIHALVTSHIDYCNAILSGIPDKLLHRLQIIQNSAARIISHTKSSDHITPILIQLRRLPVHQQIHYKILLLTFKALHNLAPPYLSELLHPCIPSWSLQSSSAALLSVPPFRLSTMSARAFSCSAPRLWNSLPPHIHQPDSITHFKSQIKTHLFKLAYSL
ncbi:hypothetical protein LDENG_00083060 [Lucifuga dentata]|nr:hypothetical protein LDENG_00083060 [Lucifuga dentata]